MNKLSLCILGTALAIAGVACTDESNQDATSRDSSGDVVEGGDVGAFKLQVGDCFDDDAEGEITSLPVVPCTEEHTGQIYHLFDLPDGSFPGTASIEATATDDCLAAFEAFVGKSFEESRFGIGWIVPTEITWDEVNDREVACTLYDVEGARLTTTAQNSGE